MLFAKIHNPNCEEIQKYISVSSNFDFKNIEPYVRAAEREFLDPVIGGEIKNQLQEFYDALESSGSGSGSGSTSGSGSGSGSGSASGSGTSEPSVELLLELLNLAQGAVINLAYLKGWPVLSVEINDIGASRFESAEKKSLYKSQEVRLIDSFKQDGFNGLDAVIAFLEKNISVFLPFKKTSYYTETQQSLIRTTAEFQQEVDINSSGLVFRRLRPYIRLAETYHVMRKIGNDLYKELLEYTSPTGSGSGSSSTDNGYPEMIVLLKKAIPWLAMSEAVKTMGPQILDNGIYYFGKESFVNDSATLTNLKPDERRRLSEVYLENGNMYLSDVLGMIPEKSGEKVGSTYPANRDNTDKKTFWT